MFYDVGGVYVVDYCCVCVEMYGFVCGILVE